MKVLIINRKPQL